MNIMEQKTNNKKSQNERIDEALDDALKLIDEAVKIPRGKPDQRVPGRLLKWKDTDAAIFIPREPKEAAPRTILKENKGTVYYKNEGEKASSYSFHCNVPADCDDPAGEIINRAMDVLGGEAKALPKVSAKRYVMDSDNVKIWKEPSVKRLSVYIVADMSGKRSTIVEQLRTSFLQVYKAIADM